MSPTVYLAFRFHGSFYHSYRGDTPDELGFGKDIRIIRHLIATLDELNAQGVSVRGTWDFENCFSLERIMPQHCPDIIESLQRRACDAGDEMNLMSYNNGLVSAHTGREFKAAIRRGISNARGSGLADLFGSAFRPIVRPQEMVFTPIHLRLYRACGVNTISLYYSALPFNGFSNFVPPLPFAQRYNPLTLTYPGIVETMTLLPCYNTGDLADHLTLRRWVRQIRRQQLAEDKPVDALLLVDMDADDEFWTGYDVPLLKGRLSTASGLRGLVENVADLEYVRWTTPGEYLDGHEPVGSITFGQDTADGCFDGMSSWAEKWSNHALWTGLDRARILDAQTRRLFGDALPADARALLDAAFEARLELLSTTHFGMAAPVMNVTREEIGRDLALAACQSAGAAFRLAVEARGAERPGRDAFALLDYARGESTDLVAYPARPSTGLVRLPLRENAPAQFAVREASGRTVPSAVAESGGRRELFFVASFEPNERKDYRIERDRLPEQSAMPVRVGERTLSNERLALTFDAAGRLTAALFDGEELGLDGLLRSGIAYAGRAYEVTEWTGSAPLSLGVVGMMRQNASLAIKPGMAARYEREIILAAGLPYLYINMRAEHPRTPDKGYSRGKAQRLQQAWDQAWQEVWPCEVRPALAGGSGSALRVWKHNYCDHVSSYDLDYGRFSPNVELDSANNHVTHGWVGVSDGERGLLIAQSADRMSGMAFCPLRTRREGDALRVRLNPFGTYWGKQYRYQTADTGLGKTLAITFSASDHINSYAPSYNGRVQELRLMLAPYRGDCPPEAVRYAAEAFAYPPLVLNDDEVIDEPAHRGWTGAGLGVVP